MKKIILGCGLLAAASGSSVGAERLPQFGIDPVEDVVKAMTLEEKVNFVVGTRRGTNYGPGGTPGMPVREFIPNDNSTSIDDVPEAVPGAVTAFTRGRVQGAAGETYGVSRLGVPIFMFADGPAGLRIQPTREGDKNTYYCTAFPTGSSLAASWDTSLVEDVTTALGNEVKEYGVDILLAPGMNIMRSPLCGRNFEYYSEDPVLAGKIAASYIRGVQSNGVGTSLKHFAVNNQETHRSGINALLSDRALREIYLRGFQIAVEEANPWTIMSSYNKINNVLAPCNKYLLTDILRGEWGYDGFVMTDWWAEGNGADQMAAGNDMLMPGTLRQYEEIIEAVKDGTLDEAVLDRNVANIMNVLLRTPTAKSEPYSDRPDLKAHAAVARDAATGGMILLENRDMTLPIAKKQKVALFGNQSYDTYVGGTGSGNVNRKYKVSLDEGMTKAGYKLDKNLAQTYTDYIAEEKSKKPADNFWTIATVDELPLTADLVNKAADESDVAVVTISRIAGEGADRTITKGDWYLTDVELDNLNKIVDAFHARGKKVAVVMNMGAMVDMDGWKNLPDAILHAWLPGQEAGNAIADVLSGAVSPSGKLPFTIARRYEDYPSATNFPYSENQATTYYAEDIFVGYRHFDHKDIEPLYPFGYGLSYTTFDYSDLAVSPDGDDYKVTVTVTNSGDRKGRETVQLYVKAPGKDMIKPVKELKGFGKTKELAPGESETLTITVPRKLLASYNEYYNRWTVESGNYQFIVAPNSTAEGLTVVLDI
ncbi:MAG: glycoside hydrolase family 3 C-terminal domain-containing protein [Muribaculaceae bacterium]|nr:glycoside hydrolase family 3 C-terminal domain-containing protein [Muribaculaceae bacterium]